MTSIFRPSLVNQPFGDPSVYVDIPWERRGLLFDLGANYDLAPRKLFKVSDAFVSHAHIDHFIGFDHLLRHRLARDRPLRLFGPSGIIERVGNKLSGYSWNLVDGYAFTIEVVEIEDGRLRRVRMVAEDGFRCRELEQERSVGPLHKIVDEELFTVEATLLDHRIPCAAFAVSERLHVNIHRDALAREGLPVGAWLRTLKQRIRAGADDETPVEVPSRGNLPLGRLRRAVVSVTAGAKMVYVVDAAFSEENTRRIVKLAHNADFFFCEAPFLHRDQSRARETYHLTARQAGWLARRAGVRRLEVFHFSPRYQGEPEALVQEAEEAFSGVGEAAGMNESIK